MTVTRRRFIALSAASLAAGPASAFTWQGRALGADAQITLHGDRQVSKTAMSEIQRTLFEVERTFSIYDPTSELSRLNASRTLAPSRRFDALLPHVDHVWRATGGAFDPTIQAYWHAFQTGADTRRAMASVGWDRVRRDAQGIHLQQGQLLSFNGIAQGAATDEIVNILRRYGYQNAMVNIGEYAGLGGPWRLGLSDPQFGRLGQATLRDAAIATSSPGAMRLGEGFHILDPKRGAIRPMWSTVTVEADTATLADGLSTALCLMSLDQAKQMRRSLPGIRRIILVDWTGNLQTV